MKIKCKECSEYFEKPEDHKKITAFGVNFCSLSCRRSFTLSKQRKEKEKNLAKQKKDKLETKKKVKREKIKVKRETSISTLTKRADQLWSEAVKINYNYECQYCGKTEYLNSHHLYTRSRRATRWDIDNGICLCSGCHTLSSNFSAHQTPLEFFEWLEGLRGRVRINELSKKSQQILKVTSEKLNNEIKNLQNFINKYNKNS